MLGVREWKTDDGMVHLIQGDALAVIPQLEGIGVFCTDPPFGARRPSAWRSDAERFAEIVGNESVDGRWFASAIEVSIDGAACYSFCTWDTLEQWRSAMLAAGWRVRSCIVWDKCIHGLADLETCWGPRHELILFGANGRHELNSPRPVDVIRVPRVYAGELQHPYQKPEELMIAILAASAGIVCDPYMGSGTTGIACIRTGRKFIGIEIDPTHYDTAVNRIQSELSRTALLEPVAKITQRSLLED